MTNPNLCTTLVVDPGKPEAVVLNNTIYIKGDTQKVKVNVTVNGSVQEMLITNTTYYKLDLPLVHFPHLIAAGVLILIGICGYIKDRNHEIISSIIAMLGPIELISYAV